MSTRNVSHNETGAALLITVIILGMIAVLVASTSMELSQQNAETAAQLASYNEARTAALTGIAGFKDFLNITQDRHNTATGSSTSCGTNALCNFVGTLTSTFWGSSGSNTVIPPNGGLGAIGYFNGSQVSINNVALENASPYVNAHVSLHIIGNTYQIGVPATSSTSSQPPTPGLITVVSQGTSGQSSATAEAVLGPVFPSTAQSVNTTVSLGGKTTAGQIDNMASPTQHTFLQAAALTTPSNESPAGFTKVMNNSTTTQVDISANTLKSQSNILFIPPGSVQTNPRIEFENIAGNDEISMGKTYRLSSNAVNKGICTGSIFGYCYQRVPIFASGTGVKYANGTWTISSGDSSSGPPALLIPGATYFDGNVDLTGGLLDNAIISNGNITDDATVYAPNYAGPSTVCGSPLLLFPTNFCGVKGTQFIPGSMGNIALYSDGSTTVGNKDSVYGDILSRGDMTTDNLNEYGFIVSEGNTNVLNGVTTVNNESAPESFNPTPLNADDYSATVPTVDNGINEPIGLLGLTWIN